MPVIVCFAIFFEFQNVEITEKLQTVRNSRTQVHGRPAVIVYYTSMCTSIVLLTWKNLRVNIEITSGLRHKFVWPKLYNLGRAINTGYEIQTNKTTV